MWLVGRLVAFLVNFRLDDGRLSTETCCLNEYNIRLPVTRILNKQLCLTVLNEYIIVSQLVKKVPTFYGSQSFVAVFM
jgi:hypothetical protein